MNAHNADAPDPSSDASEGAPETSGDSAPADTAEVDDQLHPEGVPVTSKKQFGTFGGVFTPTLLTILGVIMFLREGWIIGQAGLLGASLSLWWASALRCARRSPCPPSQPTSASARAGPTP